MKEGPNIARVAALIGERARADVLTALMSGRALTATELAEVANVTKQTISTHLAQLLEAGLLAVDHQGRHRYFRLADQDVADLLESLMGLAFRTGAVRIRTGPREPALRKARVCYDHLAGELGVLAYDYFVRKEFFTSQQAEEMQLSEPGKKWFAQFGIDLGKLGKQKRHSCRPCVDWSERRYHLAGALGAAFLQRLEALRWLQRVEDSRVLLFSASGERAFRESFAA